MGWSIENSRSGAPHSPIKRTASGVDVGTGLGGVPDLVPDVVG